MFLYLRLSFDTFTYTSIILGYLTFPSYVITLLHYFAFPANTLPDITLPYML